MKVSKPTVLFLCVTSLVSVESLTAIAGTTRECKSGYCETTLSPVVIPPMAHNKTGRIKSNPKRITYNPTSHSSNIRSSPSTTQTLRSQLPPIIPSKVKVRNVSPESILESFQYVSSQSSATYTHHTYNKNRTAYDSVHRSSFQEELQNAVSASSNESVASLTITSNVTCVKTFTWKKAVSVVGFVAIGATLATTLFLVSAPELLPDPSTTAAHAKEFFRWISSSIFLAPQLQPRTKLNINIHRFHTYFVTKFLPTAIPTLKTMAIMEIWRQIWSWTFRTGRKLYKNVFKSPYSNSLWRRYVPTFVRLGVKKLTVKATQKWIESMLEQMVGGVPTFDWSSFGDVNADDGVDLGLA